MTDCSLCTDLDWLGQEVWRDEHWRLATTVGESSTVAGFSILMPTQHIPHITDLHRFPDAARSFGDTISRCSAALKEATGASLIYVYVFGGGIPHLHVHLAPHRDGDPLNHAIIRGEVEERKLESGATEIISKDYPPVPIEEQRAVAARTRELLTGRRGSSRGAIPSRR